MDYNISIYSLFTLNPLMYKGFFSIFTNVLNKSKFPKLIFCLEIINVMVYTAADESGTSHFSALHKHH